MAVVGVEGRMAGADDSVGHQGEVGAVVAGADQAQGLAVGFQVHHDGFAVRAPVGVVAPLAPECFGNGDADVGAVGAQ